MLFNMKLPPAHLKLLQRPVLSNEEDAIHVLEKTCPTKSQTKWPCKQGLEQESHINEIKILTKQLV